jgi:hypothetical protein
MALTDAIKRLFRGYDAPLSAKVTAKVAENRGVGSIAEERSALWITLTPIKLHCVECQYIKNFRNISSDLSTWWPVLLFLSRSTQGKLNYDLSQRPNPSIRSVFRHRVVVRKLFAFPDKKQMQFLSHMG